MDVEKGGVGGIKTSYIDYGELPLGETLFEERIACMWRLLRPYEPLLEPIPCDLMPLPLHFQIM